MQIVFVWWNTSLSPPAGRRRATAKQQEVAYQVLDTFTRALQVDCIALGEVCASDMRGFQDKCRPKGYTFWDGTTQKGRLKFDTGVLYRSDTLGLVEATTFKESRGRHTLKLANRLDFLILPSKDPLHLFVSHWPSRLWCKQDSPDRHVLGIRLREKVEDIYRLYGNSQKIVLMGDYNDEPFDASLSDQLLATRDRRLLRKNRALMYNPFWRHLGEAVPYSRGVAQSGFAGSCFHASGTETRWRTFDQIIFSSAFVGGSEWHLNEDRTRILQLDRLAPLVTSSKEIFDHFPVMGVIEREDTNG